MTQILEIDGPVYASRVVKQCDEISNGTATSINTDIRNDQPTQFRPLPVINSLREVSSQMLAFQPSPDTPDGTACSSALTAVRQICYWSSLFMTMMDERNVVYPITTMPSKVSDNIVLVQAARLSDGRVPERSLSLRISSGKAPNCRPQ